MANKATQAVAVPASSAVGSVVESICGRTLVEAQASLEEIFGQTAEAEKLMAKGEDARDAADALLLDWLCQWETVDGKSVKMRRAKCDIKGEPVLDDKGKSIMAFVPISYPEYKKVIEWATAAYFERGAATVEAAEKQFQRQCNRLVALGWERPRSKSADAERMAAKRAEEAAKFADKSDGALDELRKELVAKGDLKSMKEATAITKEIERREKPEMAKLQADIKAVHESLRKKAAEWAKAGSVESLERLISALQVLG